MFNEGSSPIGILMDEIDTICKLSDKGGFTEFLALLKQNDKIESAKNKKSKAKKVKILVDDYIKLYNPIICTSNDINDKKINELKKYSEVINLNKPNEEEINLIIDDLYNIHNQLIDTGVKIEIYNHTQGDIRRLIILLEDLHYFSKNNRITMKIFEDYKTIYKEKEEDIQLIESTKNLLTRKMDILDAQAYFDVDCLLTPLMMYHNSINFIKNSDDTLNVKLSSYKNVLDSLCMHDTIQTNIFEVQDWDELYDIASIYGAAIPNYYCTALKNKKKEVSVEFTSLLNKISQMYVNKKLLNSANSSIGRIHYDNDEIIYLTEIISVYFDNYKSDSNNIGEDSDSDDDGEECEKIINVSFNKPLLNNSELITFMNKYGISIEGLENILKIEKLNRINEKRKKKFTLKIKKEITNYLLVKG